MSNKEVLVFSGSALAGLAVWVAVCSLTGRREAWDSPLYFTRGFPLMMLACAAAGFLEPSRPWRWGAAVMVLQPVALLFKTGVGSMAPLGLLLFALLSLPCVLTAHLGAVIGVRLRRKA